jgi:hypothetical protein
MKFNSCSIAEVIFYDRYVPVEFNGCKVDKVTFKGFKPDSHKAELVVGKRRLRPLPDSDSEGDDEEFDFPEDEEEAAKVANAAGGAAAALLSRKSQARPSAALPCPEDTASPLALEPPRQVHKSC